MVYCDVMDVLRKDDDWVKKCVTLEVEGAIQRHRPIGGCEKGSK